MKLIYHIQGSDFASAGIASSDVKKQLMKLNLDPMLIRRTVVALYEAEVNVVAHAWDGEIEVGLSSDRIEICVTDRGPGIPDIDLAMQKGFSTASPEVREMGFGAGMGLPNIQANMDQVDISSELNKGTRLVLINRING